MRIAIWSLVYRKSLERLQRLYTVLNLASPRKQYSRTYAGRVLLVNKSLASEVPLYFKYYFMLRSQSDGQTSQWHLYSSASASSLSNKSTPGAMGSWSTLLSFDYVGIGRHGGHMISALDSRASGPGSSPGRVFLSKTLYSHGKESQCLPQPRSQAFSLGVVLQGKSPGNEVVSNRGV